MERARERREREDAAPRLKGVVPNLLTLSIEVEGRMGASTRYTRHVVVDRAPAEFKVPCTESGCEDGGHDVTRPIMKALLDGERTFTGEDECSGYRGGNRCGRVIGFAARATYADADPSKPGPKAS